MTEPTSSRVRQWSEKLRLAAGHTPIGERDATGSASGRSPSMATIRAIEALLGISMLASRTATSSPQVDVWRAAADEGCPLPERFRQGQGWLVPELSAEGIEAWQEAELLCLHALAWCGLRDAVVLERVRNAARTCIAEVQPDNVTGRPWASHVFAWIAEVEGDVEAAMYAETLVHNALVARRGVEPVSAVLLLDSAAWLNAVCRG